MRTPATAGLGRPRVLVVEDDCTIGCHPETGLRGNDYAPVWSRTGSAALAEAARTPYDVLLLDLGRPTWTASTSPAPCAPAIPIC